MYTLDIHEVYRKTETKRYIDGSEVREIWRDPVRSKNTVCDWLFWTTTHRIWLVLESPQYILLVKSPFISHTRARNSSGWQSCKDCSRVSPKAYGLTPWIKRRDWLQPEVTMHIWHKDVWHKDENDDFRVILTGTGNVSTSVIENLLSNPTDTGLKKEYDSLYKRLVTQSARERTQERPPDVDPPISDTLALTDNRDLTSVRKTWSTMSRSWSLTNTWSFSVTSTSSSSRTWWVYTR